MRDPISIDTAMSMPCTIDTLPVLFEYLQSNDTETDGTGNWLDFCADSDNGELVFSDPYSKILKFGPRQLRVLADELTQCLQAGLERSFSSRLNQTAMTQFSMLYAFKFGGLAGVMSLIERTNEQLEQRGSHFRLVPQAKRRVGS